MTAFAATRMLYDEARGHLRGRIEQVGFFLADFDAARRTLVLREWCAIPPEGFEYQSEYHVTLTDEMKIDVIRWAWNAGACLVEAHSHGDFGRAKFSPSDLWGFRDWVPHLFWRLRARPYAALVTTGATFDALAWVEAADHPEQVELVELDDGTVLVATGRTLTELGEDADYGEDEVA
jgi:hypothetical protein